MDLMDMKEKIAELANGFYSSSKMLITIGDETRQHLILEMMKMGNCSGARVATDPDVIPTGSTVIIGDKTYIALDVGVIGKHVDILMTHEEAAVAGARRETVWWCEE